MAEFKELPSGAPLTAQVTNWFENRFPTAFAEYKKHLSETTPRRTSTSGTSSARCRCWCW
jgi:hypothetical protein